jgi:hypothetical protein
MSEPLDLQKLARIISMVGSAYDNEALNALRLADTMLRAAGMRWPDLLKPAEELAIVVEAAQVLAQENEELKAELARRRGAAAVALGHADDWYPGAAAQEKARWCLELHASGTFYLNRWELTFLNSVTEWKGRLTKRQEPVFERLLRRVAERVGHSPP